MALNFKTRALKASVALALAASLGACSQADPRLKTNVKQWSKNLGDYLNLRNGLLNPAEVGRFDKAKPWGWSKPVTWPILDKLDMIDEPNEHWIAATEPLPTDLIVEQKEYILGEGDVINVSVYELVTPGLPYNDQKVINELGKITLQNLGQVDAAGLTPTQLEQKIGQAAVDAGLLIKKGLGNPGPQVAVQLVQSRARIFNALGQVGNPGTYNIIGTDFRLLDALSLVHDIAGGNQPGMDYLYVIRFNKNAGVIPAASQPGASAPATTNPLDLLDKGVDTTKPSAAVPTPAVPPTAAVPALLVDDPAEAPIRLRPMSTVLTADVAATALLAQATDPFTAAINGGSPLPPSGSPQPMPMPAGSAAAPATAPAILGQAVDVPSTMPRYNNGQWSAEEMQAAASGMTLPRVIRIPIAKLKEGQPQYNIVIHPGDTINVPNIEPGEFYLMGHVTRPGVYSLTGRKVTLKQAVAAAGGLDSIAIPRRCDLIRRIGTTEVTVQVDLQRMFDGEQPDIFLKANDMVNVGTDALATFLAVTRNAYRASYGFGYTYDRNLYNQPVITQSK